MGIPSYLTKDGLNSRVKTQNALSSQRNARNRERRQACNAAFVNGLRFSATATDQTAAAEDPSTVPAAAQLPCGPAVSAGPWTYQQYNSNAVFNPPAPIASGAASLADRLHMLGGNIVSARATIMGPKPVASQVGTTCTEQPAMWHAISSQHAVQSATDPAAVNAAAGPVYGMPLRRVAGNTPGLARSCTVPLASAVSASGPSARRIMPNTPALALPAVHPPNTVTAKAHPRAAGTQTAAAAAMQPPVTLATAAAPLAPAAPAAYITPTPTGVVKTAEAAKTKQPLGLSCSGVLGSHAGNPIMDPTADQVLDAKHFYDNGVTDIEDVWENPCMRPPNTDAAQSNLRPRPQPSPPSASHLVYPRNLQNSPPQFYNAHAADLNDTADSAQGSGHAQPDDSSIGVGRDSGNQAGGSEEPLAGAGGNDRFSCCNSSEDMDMPSEHPASAATVAAGQACEQNSHDGQCEAANLGPASPEGYAEWDPGISFAGAEDKGNAYSTECMWVQHAQALSSLMDGLRSETKLARASPRQHTLSAAAAAGIEPTLPLQAAKRAADRIDAEPSSSYPISKRPR